MGLDVPGDKGVLAGPNTKLCAFIAVHNIRIEELKEGRRSWESGESRLEKALKMLPAIDPEKLRPSPDSLKQLKANILEDAQGEETASMSVVASATDGESYVRFIYTMTDRNTGEETPFDYKVPLVSQPCHFGGVRWWFVCVLSRNGVSCGRRVGMLYRPPRADYYGCRHCYDLSYESRNETRSGMFGAYSGVLRTERQIEDLRSRIKRWTWGGRPTRRVRRIQNLERQESKYLTLSRTYLSR